jgi:hypothetical protein
LKLRVAHQEVNFHIPCLALISNFFVNSSHWDLSTTWLKAINKNKFAFSYALHALSFVGVIGWALQHKVST